MNLWNILKIFLKYNINTMYNIFSKNKVEIWWKMIFGSKRTQVVQVDKSASFGFLETDDLYEIFNRSNEVKKL